MEVSSEWEELGGIRRNKTVGPALIVMFYRFMERKKIWEVVVQEATQETWGKNCLGGEEFVRTKKKV